MLMLGRPISIRSILGVVILWYIVLGRVCSSCILFALALSPTEGCGPCSSAQRPMRHENLLVRRVVNNRVLFTHSWGCFIGTTNNWVAYHGL